MPKFKIKLKQHTPIIHFQHDQKGATLRASELKPKLDKFLIKHAFDNNFEKYKYFLIGWDKTKTERDYKDKKPFDYKISVRSLSNRSCDIEEIYHRNGQERKNNFPLFFGNMGEENKENPKKFIMSEGIELFFASFNTSILEIIKQHICDFFMNTNFGTRQSKGFGSFYVDENDELYVKKRLKYWFVEASTNQRTNIRNEYKQLFYVIELLYKSLRSGLNEVRGSRGTVFYFKSLMFLYSKLMGIQWDKKSIKEEYFSNDFKRQQTQYTGSDILNYSSEEKKLMKDILGLSSNESWFFYNRSNITKKNKDIDRIKSPIFIKPIRYPNGYEINITNNELENIYGKTFLIMKNNHGDLQLSFPDKFDLNDFLDFAFTRVNLDDHVDSKYYPTQQFKILKNVYTQIRNNLGANNA